MGKEAGYAESTIGILEARGMISVEQAELCKKLASLRSVLYGSGNARCSSVESIGRGLPNDKETKNMRETWGAYKAATAGMEQSERRLFEHVILRNNEREWMKLPDGELTLTVGSPSVPPTPGDNAFRENGSTVHVFAKRRELTLLLRGIHTISERMPRELKAGPSATGYTAMSQAQRNALDGDAKLCELYADKGEI